MSPSEQKLADCSISGRIHERLERVVVCGEGPWVAGEWGGRETDFHCIRLCAFSNWNHMHILFLLFKFYLFIFREREREGETGRNINV